MFEPGLMGKVPGTVILRLGMGVLLLPFGGFGVPMEKVAHLGADSLSAIIDAKEVNLMPNIDIATPVSSVPTDRLALGVGPVRPGVAGIGGTLNPSSYLTPSYNCFEGNEE